jgi:AcrR family transcriptional regulator
MSVHHVRVKRPLLDVVAEVLVTDPSASLAEVAAAAGIGRTTLHKHYATRDDLVKAVGHRAVDVWEDALEKVGDGGLSEFTEALITIGPQLGFLWRSPMLDRVGDLIERWSAVEKKSLAVLQDARSDGTIRGDVSDWWLLQTFYSLIYVSSEAIRSGHLAPRDAPALVLNTLLHGIGPGEVSS